MQFALGCGGGVLFIISYASRFGDVDTKSCSVGFLLEHFHDFWERVTKQPSLLPAVYTGFVVNFYGLKQGLPH